MGLKRAKVKAAPTEQSDTYANFVQLVHLYEVYEIHFRTAFSYTSAFWGKALESRKTKALAETGPYETVCNSYHMGRVHRSHRRGKESEKLEFI